VSETQNVKLMQETPRLQYTWKTINVGYELFLGHGGLVLTHDNHQNHRTWLCHLSQAVLVIDHCRKTPIWQLLQLGII